MFRPIIAALTSAAVILAFAPRTQAAEAYVAIAMSDADTPKYGTGRGDTRDQAIAAAMAACRKAAGAECGYHYWTRSGSHMVMLFCESEIAGEPVRGGLGGHDRSSLERAKIRALRSIQKSLLRNTYSHLDAEDCRVLAQYSDGRFTGF